MKNIFPIFFLAIIFFFCGFILLRFTVKTFLIDNGVENRFTDIVVFDAKEAFKKEEYELEESIFANAVKEKLQITAGERIFESFYTEIKRKIEVYVTDLFPFYKFIVQATFFTDISLGNGYLADPLSKGDLKAIDAFVQKIGHFKHILDSLGIPLVYVQYPSVICSEDNVSKTDMLANNELIQKLRDIDIPVIDLHEEFHHSLFYKTGHHWTAKTAILAVQIIREKLNDLFDFGLKTELLDTIDFTEIFAERWLGSPKFSFSRNRSLPDGKKILLIGDSYNMPLSKFLALVFEEVNFIYLHSSLLDDYLANKPDVVAIGFNQTSHPWASFPVFSSSKSSRSQVCCTQPAQL